MPFSCVPFSSRIASDEDLAMNVAFVTALFAIGLVEANNYGTVSLGDDAARRSLILKLQGKPIIEKGIVVGAVFDGARLEPEGVRQIASLHWLRTLSVSNCGITDNLLGEIGAMTELEELNISSNHMTHDGLKRLVKLTKLKHLDISFCKSLTDAAIFTIARLVDLRHLDLSYCNVTNSGLIELKPLEKLKVLNLLRDCSKSLVFLKRGHGKEAIPHRPHG
jgi:hypothetical protein